MATAQSMDRSPARRIFRYLLAVFFVGAGVMHFVKPDFYVAIMPPYLPWHLPARLDQRLSSRSSAASACCFPQPLRRWAAWGLVALLDRRLPREPARGAATTSRSADMPASPLFNWVRLPFQLVFIAWVIWCTSPSPRR